ncbi:MAG: carboxypeptidase-like regulatory domain-containing protein, partial [Flavobacteriales bacterium]
MKYNMAIPLILTIVLLSTTAGAQQKTLSGRVVGESSKPLPQVNVVVAGTRRGTVTDLDGRFSITASKGETLRFSHIGYAQVLQKVGMDDVINLQMKPLTQRLPEVVVTGYATDTISEYVGAASTLNLQSIEKIPNVSILQSLQGSTPGLSVLS